jgi:hypothetical protein
MQLKAFSRAGSEAGGPGQRLLLNADPRTILVCNAA